MFIDRPKTEYRIYLLYHFLKNFLSYFLGILVGIFHAIINSYQPII